MITAKIIAISFIGSFVIIWPMTYFQDKEKFEFLKICVTILIIFSAYNLIAGIYLLSGWEDPLSQASGQQQGRAAARRGGGIILLAIKFWPYVLIGWAGYCFYNIATGWGYVYKIKGKK